MEDYLYWRGYYIDMAIYHVQNNLNFNIHIIPKKIYKDRYEILYNIGSGNFYEALKAIDSNPYYRHCPAKGPLKELLIMESKRKEVLKNPFFSLSA